MGKRFSWTDPKATQGRHSNFRLPPPQDPWLKYQLGDFWRRVKTVKQLRKINKDLVTYVLYKRRKTKQGYKWVCLRWVECKRETWVKWARFAIKIAPMLKKDCIG